MPKLPFSFQYKITQYLIMAGVIALVILCLFIFSSVFIIGAGIGLVLFIISYIRQRFFGHTMNHSSKQEPRIIDHQD